MSKKKITMSKELQKRFKDREIKTAREYEAMDSLKKNHVLDDLIDAMIDFKYGKKK